MMILLCFAAIIIFLFLLFYSRYTKIKNEHLIAQYNPITEEILFSLVFNNTPLDIILGSVAYKSNIQKDLFKATLLQNIITLHINYAGEYNLKLEDFYKKTGLIDLSYAKLRSSEWNVQCEGIRELTQMEVKESIYEIKKHIGNNHSTLTLESICGIIRLNGLEGLNILTDYTQPINDWIQLNILYEIDHSDRSEVRSFAGLLKSKNDSVVLLGLRLIIKFNQMENEHLVKELQINHNTPKIRIEAEKTLLKLTTQQPALS